MTKSITRDAVARHHAHVVIRIATTTPARRAGGATAATDGQSADTTEAQVADGNVARTRRAVARRAIAGPVATVGTAAIAAPADATLVAAVATARSAIAPFPISVIDQVVPAQRLTIERRRRAIARHRGAGMQTMILGGEQNARRFPPKF